MSTAIQLQPAFVLHRRDYRNTSLLLDIFSARFGRLGLVAKGARRRSAPAGPLLQPFRPLLLSWSGRGELHTLTGVEAAAPPIKLSGSGLLCGFYLNELLQRVLARNDPHLGLFDGYVGSLQALAGEAEPVEAAEPVDATETEIETAPDQATTLRRFELQLLQELGYGLVLDHCVDDGSAIEPASRYRVDPESGPHYPDTELENDGGQGHRFDQPGQPSQPGQPTALVHGRTLLGLASGQLDAQGQREARTLLRAALRPLLGEKPMHSRRLYQQYLQLRG